MPLLPSFVPPNVMCAGESSARGRQRPEETPRDDYQETLQLAPPSAAMSICLTGVMSRDGSCNVSRTLPDGSQLHGTLRYRIFRPRQLHPMTTPTTTTPPPLVVLHGGPSIPCNYLLPLVNVITDRAVIFYDQLGCGRSSRPQDKDAYSISLAVDDLILLMNEWNLSTYHMYGHSFGGILAVEYLQRTNDANCLSVILSSTPTSIPQLQEESQRLLQELVVELEGDKQQALERFRQLHECQAIPIPLSLMDAYAQAGTTWRGIQAISDYTASLDDKTTLEQPALLLRGQDDFVTQACMQDWTKCFRNTQTMVLAGCSHHGLLENEQLYGDVISSFLIDNDDA